MRLKHKDFNDAFKKKIAELPYYDSHRVRKDAVRAIEVVLSYSPEADGSFDIDEWKEKSMAWLREKYDLAPKAFGTNIISAVFHGDEARGPHIHAVIIPVDERGHLNAKRYMGNAYNLHQMKESYAEAMRGFGLVAGETRYHNRPEYERLQDLYKRTEDARDAIPQPEKGELAEAWLERGMRALDAFVSASAREGNQRRWELQREAERQADKVRADAEEAAARLRANAQAQADMALADIREREEALKKKEREAVEKRVELDARMKALDETAARVAASVPAKSGYSLEDVYRIAEEKLLRDRALEWYRGIDFSAAGELSRKEDDMLDMYLSENEVQQDKA